MWIGREGGPLVKAPLYISTQSRNCTYVPNTIHVANKYTEVVSHISKYWSDPQRCSGTLKSNANEKSTLVRMFNFLNNYVNFLNDGRYGNIMIRSACAQQCVHIHKREMDTILNNYYCHWL
jgi:hypothetical protein